MQVGIYIDVSNIYYSLKEYKLKLDYKKYLNYCQTFGDIVEAHAFGVKTPEAKSFIKAVKSIGFIPHFKSSRIVTRGKQKGDCDLDIAIKIMDDLDKIDMVILGSADGDFKPVLMKVKEAKKEIIILAKGISSTLESVADMCIEIPETFTME